MCNFAIIDANAAVLVDGFRTPDEDDESLRADFGPNCYVVNTRELGLIEDELEQERT